MSSADLLEDGFPHGTPDGFDRGCHSAGGCPTGREYGLSCKTAKMKARGDYQYAKLVKSGATIPEIADALGLIGTAPNTAPNPATRKPKTTVKPAPASPAAFVNHSEPAPDAPAAATEVSESAPDATPVLTVPEAPTHSTREIRAWAREKGYEVNSRGTIRQEIIDHYWEVHGLLDPAGYDKTAELDTAPTTPLTDAHEIPSDASRPDYGVMNLENDLAAANDRVADLTNELTIAQTELDNTIGERDRARDLAARLGEELARSEEQRDRDHITHTRVIAERDTLTNEVQRLADITATDHRTIEQLQSALAAASAALHTTERALELVLQKWDEATRAARQKAVIGGGRVHIDIGASPADIGAAAARVLRSSAMRVR